MALNIRITAARKLATCLLNITISKLKVSRAHARLGLTVDTALHYTINDDYS